MSLLTQLAEHALEKHPERAVTVLERFAEGDTIRILKRSNPSSAAEIVGRLSPHYATAVLEGLQPKRAAQILAELPLDTATRLVRRASETSQVAILEHLAPERAQAVRAVLRFPEGSAGALMDPEVLALPQELSAREALQRVRKTAALARYNLYVVDQAQRLVGALNLRELLLARGGSPLADLMVRDPHRIVATLDRASVLSHPGWREVHTLPVVDGADAYLGAIRYRRLRELEEELRAVRSHDSDAGVAFGQVIAAAAEGLLDALGGTAPRGGKGDGA